MFQRNIDGEICMFPMEPYDCQIQICRAILKSVKTQTNCLITSQTGSGKTQAAVSSAVAIRKMNKNSREYESPFIYLSRTHKQCDQALKSTQEFLKATGLKAIVLSSKKYLCINENCNQTADIEDVCKGFRQKQLCKFYINYTQMQKDYVLTSVYDISDFFTKCVADFAKMCQSLVEPICPYYFNTHILLKQADLVFAPYCYLLDPFVKSCVELNTDKSIILFDECQNLDDSAQQSGSFAFSMDELQELCVQLENRRDEINSLGSTGDLITFKNSYSELVKLFSSVNQKLKSLFRNKEIFSSVDLCNWGFFQTDKIKSNLATVVKYAGNTTTGRFGKRICVPHIDAKYTNFINRWNTVWSYCSEYNEKYDYTLDVKYNDDGSKKELFECCCLMPDMVIDQATKSSKSIIMMSGNEIDVKFMDKMLGLRTHHHEITTSVISPQNFRTIIVGKTNENSVLVLKSSTYDNEQTHYDIANFIWSFSMLMPDGLLCFLPSHKCLEKLKTSWTKTGLLTDLQANKYLFWEQGDSQNVEDTVAMFKEKIDQGFGCVLIAVYRGRIAEGIDFPNKYCRTTIAFGIPYPNEYSTQMQAKKKHFEEKFGPELWKLWIKRKTFGAVNQALGRTLRHRRDWGLLVLADQRYVSSTIENTKFLSKWITEKYTVCDSFDVVENTCDNFKNSVYNE